MRAITIDLETLQPVLATSFQGDPNIDVSFSYLPGSVIRGALIGRYLKLFPARVDLLADATAKRLFFDGTTRYLNGYLRGGETQPRSLPIPRCWQRVKEEDSPTTIYDLSEALPNDDITTKSISEGFCSVNNTNFTLYKEQRRINIHNQRDRLKGRATKTSGEVFRYEALDAGQQFQAVILCDHNDDIELIQNLLKPAELWLGGSQSAGYGHIKIVQSAAHKDEDQWNEVGIDLSERIEDRTTLKLTLLSDLIVRDNLGQLLISPPTDVLSEFLGVQLTLKDAYLGSICVGGFNRKWGLPLPQLKAIAAGSVLIYEMPTSLNLKDTLVKLEQRGLGERRIEGFGRIAVNWFKDEDMFTVETVTPKPPEKVSLTNDLGIKIAKEMADRLLKQKLDALLLAKVQNCHIQNLDSITNSQLSRLMITAKRVLAQSECSESVNLQPITDLLANLTKSSKSKMESAKIDGRSLLSHLQEWLKPPHVWIMPKPTVEIASIISEVTENLARIYTLKLISAVAKQAIKERDQDANSTPNEAQSSANYATDCD